MPTELSSFKFQAEPKALRSKTKYRNENDVTLTLMSDPRVVRGNTHSLARKVALAAQTNAMSMKLQRKDEEEVVDQLPFPTYMVESRGFVSDGVDLSQFLEENPARSMVIRRDESTQVDALRPRPETPPYIPAKTGIDCATQIEDPNELFNFDLEVSPMLNVIVDKTIEQALFECQAEAELDALSDAAEDYKKKKEVEIEWMKRREKEVSNEIDRKRLLVFQKQKEYVEKKDVCTLVAGKQCFKQILPDAVDNIFNELFASGTWEDPVVTVIREEVMPALSVEVANRATRRNVAATLIDDLLQAAQTKYDGIKFEGDPRKRQRVMITFTIPASKLNKLVPNDVKIGPIELNGTDTILTMEAKIKKQMETLGLSNSPYQVDAKVVQSYMSSAIGRDIPVNVPLLNYFLPNNLSIVV